MQRCDDGTGLAARHKKREYRTRCCDKQHRRHHRQQNRRNARLGLRQADNLAVIKGDGAIQHNLVERRACALRGTRTTLKGLDDLGAIAMVGQCGRRRLVVVGNRSILVNQRDAQVLSIEATQERDGLLLLVEGGSNELGFLRQVGTRASAKVFCTKNAPSTVNATITAMAQTKIVTKTRCDSVCFPWGAKTTGYSSDAVAAVSSPSAPSPAEGSAKR